MLSLINRRQVGEGDFYYKENGAVLLGDDGRKTFLSAWYKRKKEVLQHPFLAENRNKSDVLLKNQNGRVEIEEKQI